MTTSTLPQHPTARYPRQHPLAGLAVEAVGMIGGRPVWPIMGGDGTGDDGGDQGGDDGGKGGDDGTRKPPPADGGRTFSQADLDRIVTERVAAQKRAHDRELEQARSDAGKSDTQRIEAERDRAVEQAKAAQQKAAPRVAQALAQVAAITAGGRADRAAAIVRVADLDGVAKFDGDDWTVDETKLGEAIGKVLDEYPEWKADAGSGSGDGKGDDDGKGKRKPPAASGGDLGGGKGDGITLEAFKRMDMGERGKLASEDPETYRRLSDAEIDGAARPAVASGR